MYTSIRKGEGGRVACKRGTGADKTVSRVELPFSNLLKSQLHLLLSHLCTLPDPALIGLRIRSKYKNLLNNKEKFKLVF